MFPHTANLVMIYRNVAPYATVREITKIALGPRHAPS
jgi:hypothetical protein